MIKVGSIVKYINVGGLSKETYKIATIKDGYVTLCNEYNKIHAPNADPNYIGNINWFRDIGPIEKRVVRD